MTQSEHGEASNARFFQGMQKAHAWDTARQLAEFFERMLTLNGYAGPVCVAGGYVRDVALNRPPKDCDMWLDSGAVLDVAHAEWLAAKLCKVIGHGATVERVLKSYGTWSADIQYVLKIELDPDIESPMMGTLTIPHSIDFIVLRQDSMKAVGYEPSAHMTPHVKATFLEAVLRRVDLRLNAIGASSVHGECCIGWDDDAMNHRLVVQHARADEDLSRIQKRLERLGGPGGKYAGWECFMEGPFGELGRI